MPPGSVPLTPSHCSPAFSLLYAPCLPQAEGKNCLFSQQLPGPVVPHWEGGRSPNAPPPQGALSENMGREAGQGHAHPLPPGWAYRAWGMQPGGAHNVREGQECELRARGGSLRSPGDWLLGGYELGQGCESRRRQKILP